MTPTPPPRLSTKARPWLSLFDSFLRTRPFRPHRWLGNPHLQTLVTNSRKRDFSWGWRHCEQRLLELEDDSRIRVVTVKGRKDAPHLDYRSWYGRVQRLDLHAGTFPQGVSSGMEHGSIEPLQ